MQGLFFAEGWCKMITLLLLIALFSFSGASEKVEKCNVGKFWKEKENFVVKGGICDKRCELYYRNDDIREISLKIDGNKCKDDFCDVSFVGNYYLSEGENCLSYPNFIEIGIKYNKKNFIPFCDFVSYEKKYNSGILKFKHEGKCFYKAIKAVNMDMSVKEYNFGVMRIVKGIDGSLKIEKEEEIPYYIKRENYNNEKNEVVFHSCTQHSCRIAIEDFYDEKTKVSLVPQCDFLRYEQTYSKEDGSFGTIIAKDSGSCLVLFEMSSEIRGLHVTPLYNHREENLDYEYDWISFGPYEKKRKSFFRLVVPKDMRDLPNKALNLIRWGEM